MNDDAPHVAVIGAGFTGLSAAYELCKAGLRTTVIEADDDIGGLAGSFSVAGTRLEKFYHHWFTNDRHVEDLVGELGLSDRIRLRPTRTGSFFANSIFRLSRPLDVLRYTPLSVLGRLRLGFLIVQARLVHDWRTLENTTASEWLRHKCGNEVFETVWYPLLKGKFGPFADDISAVWFWNKLMLRGGSRSKSGQEWLSYYDGGFAGLAEALASAIRKAGGRILTGRPVTGIVCSQGKTTGVVAGELISVNAVICTTPIPIFSELVRPHVSESYINQLERIKYIGNVCMILELDRSLSDTYWLNVSDPAFPFVAVIEHTNLEPASSYWGRHIVYISKYLPTTDPLYGLGADELFNYALPFIMRIFPEFKRAWVLAHHCYHAPYSQPLITRNYGPTIPSNETPLKGLLLSTMAQIYPEDRGTNYAIREGRIIGRRVAADLRNAAPVDGAITGS